MKFNTDSKPTGISFRTQLILFGLALVALVALPALVVDLRRPWDALDSLIDQGEGVISGVRAGFDQDDLEQMNDFSLRMASTADPEWEDGLIWSFNFLLERGALPAEDEMRRLMREQELDDLDYAALTRAFDFWQDAFVVEPGLLDLFRQYKRLLRQARENAIKAGFDYKDLYAMVDDGENLAFVIDGSEWFESTYPGLRYDASEQPYFRGYLRKGPGFDANPRHYFLGLFPKFDTDKWGTWFSVWLSSESRFGFNNFSMDFDADRVKALMWKVGGIILAIALLELLAIALLTERLTRLISIPIVHILTGTEAVINGDYDHVVPSVESTEFRRPIAVFNQMIKGLRERFNMMQTLERLLSKELAEQVAKHGLVLGGQNVEITNLFTDFAGFSSITRRLSPEETVGMLNEYFTMLIPIIKKWGGLPDKYIGDAIVAIFGAPVHLENHAEYAVACAIEMQLAMRRFNEARRREGKVVVEMRIGLNSGEVIAGAMGSDMKLEYTTIGETTNFANRMESLAQIGHVLMSEATYEKVKHIFFEGVRADRQPQYHQVKGYPRPMAAYNIFVADLEIKKNDHAEDPKSFYVVGQRGIVLQKSADLSPEEKAGYRKFVNVSRS